MKRFLFIVSFLLSGIFGFSIENHPVGARPRALSDAFVSISDVWSTFHNQAGIAGMKQLTLGFYYESRYMIDELSLTAGSVLVPVNQGCFGISFYQFGRGSFKENKFALAYSLPLSARLKAAVQLDYYSQLLPENDRSKGFVTFETGFIYQLASELILGAHILNPLGAGIRNVQGQEKLPFVFRLGGHYNFDEMVLVVLEVQKNSGNKAIIKSGVEFSPAKNLALRVGVSGKPVNYTAGIGYSAGKLTADISFGYHGNLGITPAISIQFAF